MMVIIRQLSNNMEFGYAIVLNSSHKNPYPRSVLKNHCLIYMVSREDLPFYLFKKKKKINDQIIKK